MNKEKIKKFIYFVSAVVVANIVTLVMLYAFIVLAVSVD